MGNKKVIIEYVQNCFPFEAGEEFVVIVNNSNDEFKLAGWKLVYENYSTRTVEHTHHFSKLSGSFDPGERLCVISGVGENEFVQEGTERRFPGAHWDIQTGHPLRVLDFPKARVTLYDEAENVIDSMIVERSRTGPILIGEMTVFIGHGRDPQWRDLKDHLQDQHKIKVTAYEIGPRAGLSVKEVLEKMLRESSFALLVLTGEDLHNDGELHARENVVHELGLFQGQLGFTRAIALLEDGVKEFSNILGLNQLRFPKGKIRHIFGDVIAAIANETKSSGA